MFILTPIIIYSVQDLAADLEDKLSGDFRDCCKALCLAPEDYDASQVYKAVKVTTIPLSR